MTEQAENELICEKLLRWRCSPYVDGWTKSCAESANVIRPTPTFTDWASAGMILEAAHKASLIVEVKFNRVSRTWWCYQFDNPSRTSHYSGETGPLAIRAAALEYVRSLQK